MTQKIKKTDENTDRMKQNNNTNVYCAFNFIIIIIIIYFIHKATFKTPKVTLHGIMIRHKYRDTQYRG